MKKHLERLGIGIVMLLDMLFKLFLVFVAILLVILVVMIVVYYTWAGTVLLAFLIVAYILGLIADL